MANPLLSNPLISYLTPSVKVSQGLGVASDAFSNLRHLSFASITPWCKQKGNRQEIENKDVNYQITKADYKVEEDGLLICKDVILGFFQDPTSSPPRIKWTQHHLLIFAS